MIEVNSIVINYTTYQDNEVIEEVDLAFVPWKNNSMNNAFQNSPLLRSVNNFNNSVTNAQHAFDNCDNLQNTPIIPNSVTDVSYIFANCRNIINTQNFVSNQYRNTIINAQGMFENCPKITYANFYYFNNVKDISKAYKNCLSLTSFAEIQRMQNVENMDELFMDTQVNGYGYYASYYDINNYTNLQSIKNIYYNCSNLSYERHISNCPNLTDISGAFYGCKNVSNVYIDNCPNIINMANTFYECYKINYINEIPQNVTNMYGTFRNCRNLSNIPTIPQNVVDMSGTFCDCNRITDAPEIPSSVTNIVTQDGAGIFQHCDNMSGIVKISSSEIENAVNTFRGTTLQKSLLIPFKYENGEYTKTYNAFNTAGYSSVNRTEDGVLMFDIDTDPELLTWRFEVVDNKSILYEYLGSENIITVPNNNTMVNCYNLSNSYSNQVNLPFYINKYINSVDLNNVNFVNNSMVNVFLDCWNLTEVTNISNNIEDMSCAFWNCYKLINVPEIPNSVINMANTFYHCNSIENAPIIGNGVVDMSCAFYYCYKLNNVDLSNCTNLVFMYRTFGGCTNLINAPAIPNGVTNMSATFFNCYNLVNAPVIPNSVTDMGSTFYYCNKLTNAPVIPNSVTDMPYTFYNCRSLINAPAIPNGVTNMSATFFNCYNLVNAPDMSNATNVTNMYNTFYNCNNIENAPVIPNSVTDMCGTFSSCYKLIGDIIILSENIVNANRCFYGTLLDKNVYIPFYYDNGQPTVSYNSFTNYYRGGYSTTNRVNGVILRDAKLYDWRYEYLNNGIRLLKEYTGENTRLIVPNNISIINNYNSSYQTDMPFYNNQKLTSVDLKQMPFVNNDMSYAFYNSGTIEEVDGIFSVENMAYAFQNCANLKNVYITSESVYNVEGIFDNTNDTEKNVYIPLLDIFDGETITYQVFKDAGYSTTVRKNGALLKDISIVDIDLEDYDYDADEYNNVEITKYKGNEEIINTPNV